jgi:hypothetical protein
LGVKVEFFILSMDYLKNAPTKAITIFGYATSSGPSRHADELGAKLRQEIVEIKPVTGQIKCRGDEAHFQVQFHRPVRVNADQK